MIQKVVGGLVCLQLLLLSIPLFGQEGPSRWENFKSLKKVVMATAFEEGEEFNLKEWLLELRDPSVWKEEFQNRLNFKRIIRDANRSYWQYSTEPEFRGHFTNLLGILGISHTIEATISLSALPYMVVGAINGVGFVQLASQGVAMLVVIVPGLDPLCYILAAGYGLTMLLPKPLNEVITKTRVAAERGVRFVSGRIGFDRLIESIAPKMDPMELMSERFYENIEWEKPYRLERQRLGKGLERLSLHRADASESRPLAELSFERYSDKDHYRVGYSDAELQRMSLREISVARGASSHDMEGLRQFMQSLLWIPRETFREVLNAVEASEGEKNSVQELRDKFYVEEVLETRERVEVRYTPRSINAPFKRQWRPNTSASCRKAVAAAL